MTVILTLDFYDNRLGYQIQGGNIFYGGSDGGTEEECIRRARHEMVIKDKEDHTLKIIRNEHRKTAKLDAYF